MIVSKVHCCAENTNESVDNHSLLCDKKTIKVAMIFTASSVDVNFSFFLEILVLSALITSDTLTFHSKSVPIHKT